MKLALIRRRYSATGGAEQYLQRLLEALLGAGHELHLFAETWEGAPSGVRLHTIPGHGSRATRPRQFAEQVDRELMQDRYDCVFSLERTLRQDVYRAGDGVHRVWLERRRQFAPWWRRPFVGLGGFHRTMLGLESATFDPRNTRIVIANSGMVKEEILRHFAFPPARIQIVRNGIHVDRFRAGNRAGTRARFGVEADEVLLLFVGSGWERKGLRFLLQALAARERPGADSRAPRARVKLLVVGKGRPPRRPPANVIFAGPMPDVEHAYAAADVFVFLPIYEPSANVCVEALAAGLPVVTTLQNGASELVRDGETGSILPDPSDSAAVARAIDFWSANRAWQRVTTTSDLTLERNVAETVALLELAARENRSVPAVGPST